MHPKVTIQALPFDAATSTSGISYDFTMLQSPSNGSAADLEFVYIECFDDVRYLDTKDVIASYVALWNRLQAASLDPKESLDLLRSVEKQYSE